jgi:ribosomal protein L30/L7E
VGATLETLGLHRLHQASLHPYSPALVGKILAVKELVRVRNVGEEEGRRILEAGRNRGEGAGVVVQGRVYGGGGGRA